MKNLESKSELLQRMIMRNGSEESANPTLRNLFRKIRSADNISSFSAVLSAAAACGKNVSKGGKLAYSFESMYSRKPFFLSNVIDKSSVVTIEQFIQQRSKLIIQKMLNSAVRKLPDIRVSDFVLFWRDNSRCFCER